MLLLFWLVRSKMSSLIFFETALTFCTNPEKRNFSTNLTQTSGTGVQPPSDYEEERGLV
jgi:hypothetical protein